MKEIGDFFSGLIETDLWPARWHCGEWSDFHGWLYVGSDVMIWLAYFIIPVIIIWFVQNKTENQFRPVFILFGLFIILCGATHLIDAVIFWWPAYRLSALLRFLCAFVSVATMIALVKEMPAMIGADLRNSDYKKLEKQLKEKELKIIELEKALNGN